MIPGLRTETYWRPQKVEYLGIPHSAYPVIVRGPKTS